MELEETSKMEVDEHMSDNINLDELLKIIQKSMKKDEYWYLLDRKWFDQCEKFIRDKEPTNNPGPIDNSSLIKSKTGNVWQLKEQLDEEDYQFIPEKAWNALVGYFGIKNVKHSIRRLVIEEGKYTSHCIVEVYPIELEVRKYGQSQSVTRYYSRVTTLRELEKDMKRIFKVDPSQDTQIYHEKSLLNAHVDVDPDTITPPLKANDNKTLVEASVYSGTSVALEVRNADGSWPSQPRLGVITRKHANRKSYTPGLCGLSNLGNTCFMNSALQCLSNTPPLTEFITSDKYLNEINIENPLGMKGKIANTYGEMIKNMWSGNTDCFCPRDFKYAVGCFAPQFSGYAQQDCQELMAFLLDGLHEDLNRIKKKPYIETRTDIDTREDHVKAQESWENYKKRNDSIIVDTFHGLLKSTLICPDCNLVSVTFDPFCYLSLPLPGKRDIQIDVILIPAYTKSNDPNDNAKEIRSVAVNQLSIPKYGSIIDISKAVAKAVNDEQILAHTINPSKLLVTEVSNHRFNKIFENEDSIVMNMDNLVIYELLEDTLSIPVYLREIKRDGTSALFGRPFYLGVKDSQFESIYEAVGNYLKIEMNDSVSDESSDSDEGVAECKDEAEPFSLSSTSLFGTVDLEKLDGSKPIHLNNKTYLAVNLSKSAKTKYLDEYGKNESSTINMPKMSNQQRSSIPLSECIKNFTTIEKLGPDDPWYCSTCKKHQQATKKFDLWDLPNVLIIHLKRFSYTRFWRDKLDVLVDFPITELDMGEYVINNPDKKPILYDLIAVSNHSGGLGGGHYTAYAKNCQTDNWHFFNDASVSDIDVKSVVSKQGYVLYYLKRN